MAGGADPWASWTGAAADSATGAAVACVPDDAGCGGVEGRFAGGAMGLIAGGSEVGEVRCVSEVERTALAVGAAFEVISPLIWSTWS